MLVKVKWISLISIILILIIQVILSTMVLFIFQETINLRPFKNHKINDFYNDFDINVMGLVRILKFYIPYFNDGCSIVFVSSIAAKSWLPYHSSISMSKSALVGLCKALAAEYAPKFRLNCISPSLLEVKCQIVF